ncbi:MAG: alpha/beta fold hydrolase [Pikeienuella sp.]
MTTADHNAPFHAKVSRAPEGGEVFWLNAKGARIRAAVWAGGERGTVILFNGRTEFIEKYGDVVTQLRERGFSVATLDWRGQGLSDRACDDPMKGHVSDFDEYQNDIETLLAAPQVAALKGPYVLIAHSMGGCIGMRALMDGRIKPAAALMSAPMLDIELPTPTRIAAGIVSRIAGWIGKDHTYAPQPDPTISAVEKQAFEGNLLTSDPDEYALMQAQLVAEPGFGLGAPTLGWMRAAFDEIADLRRNQPPATPMVIALGGKEGIVSPSAIHSHVQRAANCDLLPVEGAQHETLMETPERQAKVWAAFDALLDKAGI